MKGMIIVILFVFFVAPFALSAGTGENEDDVRVANCLAAQPGSLKAAEYYECEKTVVNAFSGSGGFFLTDEATEWIKKGRKKFANNAGRPYYNGNVHSIYGWSYYHAGKYDKALREFREAKDRYSEQLVRWTIDNGDVRTKGGLLVKSGLRITIPRNIGRTADLKVSGSNFVGLFKGGIYRCSRGDRSCELLYLPESQYNWPKELSLEGDVLAATLINNDIVRYDMAKNAIQVGD